MIIYALIKIQNDNDNYNNIFIIKFLNNILNEIDALVLDYDCQNLFELVLKMVFIEKNLINYLIKINFVFFLSEFFIIKAELISMKILMKVIIILLISKK